MTPPATPPAVTLPRPVLGGSMAAPPARAEPRPAWAETVRRRVAATVFRIPAADGGSGGSGGGKGVSDSGSRTPSKSSVVAYLPNYSGSYGDWAKTIDFTKMTHLNLAFANRDGDNGWDMGASDGERRGARGGGARRRDEGARLARRRRRGPDRHRPVQRRQRRAPGAEPRHVRGSARLDGVDVDIEDPSHLGADYSTFVDAVVAKLRPEGKLVTAAVAQYLQDSMSDATLHTFDFVNVMIYSNYDDSVSALTYYAQTKGVPGRAHPGRRVLRHRQRRQRVRVLGHPRRGSERVATTRPRSRARRSTTRGWRR